MFTVYNTISDNSFLKKLDAELNKVYFIEILVLDDKEKPFEHLEGQIALGGNINIDGKNKHFVRYKRTSGSARVGKCLFISDKLAKEMIDWSFAGIEHSEGTTMDCAGMEAYISLMNCTHHQKQKDII